METTAAWRAQHRRRCEDAAGEEEKARGIGGESRRRRGEADVCEHMTSRGRGRRLGGRARKACQASTDGRSLCRLRSLAVYAAQGIVRRHGELDWLQGSVLSRHAVLKGEQSHASHRGQRENAQQRLRDAGEESSSADVCRDDSTRSQPSSSHPRQDGVASTRRADGSSEPRLARSRRASPPRRLVRGSLCSRQSARRAASASASLVAGTCRSRALSANRCALAAPAPCTTP